MGVNGEISYIAVQEPVMPQATPNAPTPQDAMFLQQIQQNSAMRQQSNIEMTGSVAPRLDSVAGAHYAERERMRLELEILQKKISDLNLAHLAASDPTGELRHDQAFERNELAKELQIIESTIRDREREIAVNHMNLVDNNFEMSSAAITGNYRY